MCCGKNGLLALLQHFCFSFYRLLPDIIPEDSASPVLSDVLTGGLFWELAGLQAS